MNLKLIEPLRELFKRRSPRIRPCVKHSPEMLSRQPFPALVLPFVFWRSDVRTVKPVTLGRYHRSRRNSGRGALSSSLAVVCGPFAHQNRGSDGRRTYLRKCRGYSLRDESRRNDCRLGSSALPGLLGKISNRIINEVRGINRVVYDISSKPPATIE